MNHILFIIIGAGMGHLTRGLAVARQITRLREGARIVFFTVTDAPEYVKQYGYEYEYFPKFGEPGAKMGAPQYNQWMKERLESLIRVHSIDTVIFDGAFPFDCLIQILLKRQDMLKIWLKREGDRQNYDSSSLALYKRLFHKIIIPEEAGDTKERHNEKNEVCVPPIIQLLKDEIIPRKMVRNYLNVSESQKVWYLQIRNQDTYYRRNLLDDAIRALLSDPEAVILINRRNPVTQTNMEHERIRSISEFPIAKYFQGVDFAITAAGYNTVHELVSQEIPSILVPNRTVVKDDQLARAKRIEGMGAAIVFEQKKKINHVISELKMKGEKMKEQLMMKEYENGSLSAAKIILEEASGGTAI